MRKISRLAHELSREVVLLLDAVDHQDIGDLDLREWSRLRAASEAWWASAIFAEGTLASWRARVDGELAPGVLPGAGAEVAEGAERMHAARAEASRRYEEARLLVGRMLNAADREGWETGETWSEAAAAARQWLGDEELEEEVSP